MGLISVNLHITLMSFTFSFFIFPTFLLAAIIQMLVFMGGVLSQLTSGLWIEHFGFIAPSWLVLTCHVASGLWVIFMVPENHERVTNVKHKFFDLKNLKTLVNVFKKARPDGARKCLLFLVIAGAILTLTVQGLGGVTALFVMRSPLCFGPKLVGYLLAYRMFLSGFGGAVGVKLFRTFVSEKVTAAIGIISQIAEMGLFAFADSTWLVFIGKYFNWSLLKDTAQSNDHAINPSAVQC